MAKQLAEETGLKECFIVTPIGSSKSLIREKTTGLIKSVITPVLKNAGFTPIAAHNLPQSGSINHQIVNKILSCELVIVNLTGLNPNVVYELAIRHAARLPVITMMEKGDESELPFDLIDQRTIFYEDSLNGSEEAKEELAVFVESALKIENPDNPIYAATKQHNILKEFDKGDAMESILKKIDYLASQVSSLTPQRKPTGYFFSPSTPEGLRKRIKIKIFLLKDNGEPQAKILNAEMAKIYDDFKAEIQHFTDLRTRSIGVSKDLSYVIADITYGNVQEFHAFYSVMLSNKNYQIVIE